MTRAENAKRALNAKLLNTKLELENRELKEKIQILEDQLLTKKDIPIAISYLAD